MAWVEPALTGRARAHRSAVVLWGCIAVQLIESELIGRPGARSFAIVLWECTARQVPYAGLDGIQVRLHILLAHSSCSCAWHPLSQSGRGGSPVPHRLSLALTLQLHTCCSLW